MEKKGIKADFTLIAILLIPIAIAINFIGGNLVLALSLPLYLDSMGTYLVGMLAGPWLGLITGVISICINSISNPTLLPYSILAGAMGLVVGILARKGMFNTIVRTIISGLIVALCSIVATVVIKYIFFGGFGVGGVSALVAGLMSAGIPFWVAQFVGQLIAEVPDKVISVLISFLVVKAMSDRYLIKFSNGPIFIEANKKRKEKKQAN